MLREAAACNELLTQLSGYLAAADPAAISDPGARIKATGEPGGDVVEVLTGWFAGHGCDLSLAAAEDS